MSKGHDKFRSKNKAFLESVMFKLNQIPKDILYSSVSEAFVTAVELTKQDSGNAAWHWTITGLRAMERGDPRLDFSIKYGMSPIGNKGDKGANSEAVSAQTIEHGLSVLHRMIYQDGRKAVTIANTINSSKYRKRALPATANMITKAAHEAARRAAIKTKYTMDKGY